MRQRDRILAFVVLLELAARPRDRRLTFDRNLVALHQLDLEEDQLRSGGRRIRICTSRRPNGRRAFCATCQAAGCTPRRRRRRTPSRRARSRCASCQRRSGSVFTAADARPAIDDQRVLASGAARPHDHGGGAGLRNAKLRVVVRVARVQRLRCEDGRALTDLDVHARGRPEFAQRAHRIQQAVRTRGEARQRNGFRPDRARLARHRGQRRRCARGAQRRQQDRHSHFLRFYYGYFNIGNSCGAAAYRRPVAPRWTGEENGRGLNSRREGAGSGSRKFSACVTKDGRRSQSPGPMLLKPGAAGDPPAHRGRTRLRQRKGLNGLSFRHGANCREQRLGDHPRKGE